MLIGFYAKIMQTEGNKACFTFLFLALKEDGVILLSRIRELEKFFSCMDFSLSKNQELEKI